MTPTEHYELSERLLVKAENSTDNMVQHLLLQFAQVHATLASCTWEYYRKELQ